MNLDRKISTIAGVLILGMYAFVLGYLLVFFSKSIENNTRYDIEKIINTKELDSGVE